jgi:integrase
MSALCRSNRLAPCIPRTSLSRSAQRAGRLLGGLCRRRHNHQLRHAHAVELMHEGIPLPLIQRQLGHSHLSTTGTYLEGINTEEIISPSTRGARQ